MCGLDLVISTVSGLTVAVFGIWAFLKGFKSGMQTKSGAAPNGLFEKEPSAEKSDAMPISKQISEMFRTQVR